MTPFRLDDGPGTARPPHRVVVSVPDGRAARLRLGHLGVGGDREPVARHRVPCRSPRPPG